MIITLFKQKMLLSLRSPLTSTEKIRLNYLLELDVVSGIRENLKIIIDFSFNLLKSFVESPWVSCFTIQ